MRLFRIIWALLVLVCASPIHAADLTPSHASAVVEPVTHDGAAPQSAHAEHHGLPANAVKVFKLGSVVITNSMVVTILVTLGIVLFAQLVSRKVTPVPNGLQNFAEWLVESMYNFLGEILGPKLVKQMFWFFGTIFFFILFTNWFGLIPGVGTVGWKLTDPSGAVLGFEP